MGKPIKGATGKPQKSGNGPYKMRETCECLCVDEYNQSCCGDCDDENDNWPNSVDVTFSGISNCGTFTVFTDPGAPGGSGGYPNCDITETPNDLEIPCTDLHDTTFNCPMTYSTEDDDPDYGTLLQTDNVCLYRFLGTDNPHCSLYNTLDEVPLGNIEVRVTVSGRYKIYWTHPEWIETGKITVKANTHYGYNVESAFIFPDTCFSGSVTMVNEDNGCSVCESMPNTIDNLWESDDCGFSSPDPPGPMWTNGGYGGTATVDRG